MGADNVGNLNAKLGLDATSFSEGLDKAQQKAEKAVSGIQGTFSKLAGGQVFGGLASLMPSVGGLVAGGGIGALSAGVGMAVKEFVQLNNAGTNAIAQQAALARRFEMTTGAAGALQLAAERYGVSQDELNVGIAHMYRMLDGLGPHANSASSAFRRLGLDIQELRGRPGEALQSVIDRMGSLDAVSREAISRQIFGRQGSDFSAMASRLGPGGLTELQRQGEASGAIASASQVEDIASLRREIRQMEMARSENARVIGNNAATSRGPGSLFSGETWEYGIGKIKTFFQERLMHLLGLDDSIADPSRMNPDRRSAVPAAAMQSYDALHDKLQEQIATIGMTTEAVERYRLAHAGATQAMIATIQSLQQQGAGARFHQAMQEQHDQSVRYTANLQDSARSPFQMDLLAYGERERKHLEGVQAAPDARSANIFDYETGPNGRSRRVGMSAGTMRERLGMFQGIMNDNRSAPNSNVYRNAQREAQRLQAELRSMDDAAKTQEQFNMQGDRQRFVKDLTERRRTEFGLSSRTFSERFSDQAASIHELTRGGDIGAGVSVAARPDLAARGYLGLLGQAESQLGLNQPVRQAAGLTYGSSSSIAAVNTARLQQERSGQSVQERIEAVNKEMLEVQRINNRQQAEMLRFLQGRGGGNPFAGGGAIDDIDFDVAE